MPNGKCRIHGGKTPRGLALPQTKHGRYSKDLPTRLAESFEEFVTDPDILNLNREIALTDARTDELIQRLSTGESGELWGSVAGVHRDLSEALDEGDLDEISQQIDRLGTLIAAYRTDESTWRAINTQKELRRRLVDSEQKRRVAMQDMITSERAMVLIATLSDSVKRHVDDPNIRAAIAADLGTILSRRSD